MSQQHEQRMVLRIVQQDGAAAADLTVEDVARFPGSVLAALLQDTRDQDPGPAVIRLSRLPDSPLTACPQTVALVAGLFKDGRCFPAPALHSLLEATPSADTSCRQALGKLRRLLDYLAIPGSVSTFLPSPDAAAVCASTSRLLYAALADEAAALMLACAECPHGPRSHHPGEALGCQPGRMFLLVAGHDDDSSSSLRPRLSVHLLLSSRELSATGGYAQRLLADGSSMLHRLHDVVAGAAAASSCSGRSLVGPDHPEFGGLLFEALVSRITRPPAGASSSSRRFKCGTRPARATGSVVPVWLVW